MGSILLDRPVISIAIFSRSFGKRRRFIPEAMIAKGYLMFDLNAVDKRWYHQIWVLPCILILLSGIMLLTGLSIRSLWGSEGRWAEVVREMIRSGNYFLPTINGRVYFDKPLLSYWTIVLVSFKGVVTEASSRLPSAVSGVGAVLLTFAIGRRLFGNRAGAISAMLLLTSVMFILWARTASAELLNLFAVWLALWFFLADEYRNRLVFVISLYVLGAVAAFLKGLVGPAVIFASIGFCGTVEFFADMKGRPFTISRLADSLSHRFSWVLSRSGVLGILVGSAIFTVLLLTPVFFTGSWQSVDLMWRENVLRFFLPFDHIEPPYIYLKYIPLFFAPWTLLFIASLFEVKKLLQTRNSRWIVLIALAIFIFYTASGSRRSYYILPILPALAIITGSAIDSWLKGASLVRDRIFQAAAIVTSAVLLILGLGLIYAYFDLHIPRHASQLAIGTVSIVGSILSIRLFLHKERFRGFVILFTLIFVVELWGITVGMALGEHERTLRPFSQEVGYLLRDVRDDKIALYQVEDSALVFYLNRSPLKSLSRPEELKTFMNRNPDGFVIANMSTTSALQGQMDLDRLTSILVEKKSTRKRDDPLALFALKSVDN
jgi:4-amino-4-deoxy-L-arabinose transferase-like glycosyltransferase